MKTKLLLLLCALAFEPSFAHASLKISDFLKPDSGQGRSTKQYSIEFINGDFQPASLTVYYYIDTSCSTEIANTVLNGSGSSFLSGHTYVSTDASNFALCSIYSEEGRGVGCSAALNDVQSIKVLYHLWNSSPFWGACFHTTPTNNSSGACNSGADCGYSPSGDTPADVIDLSKFND